MPKSAKKRKDKAADFSKAKLKLGKGKKAPTNAIDTSFKARSIALPTQSIAIERDEGPTTRRNLSFDDLISHIKHHNAGARRDALLGLRELLDGHPELMDDCLTTLFNACVGLIGDEDANVRKTLLSFLAWLIPLVPSESLIPHSPLLLLFTTSAQTHIFPEIRIDAIRFLDLFLEHLPEIVVAGWTEHKGGHGSRILEGYLGILNAGTKFGEDDGPIKATSTASVVLSPASKLIALQSLSTFLQIALPNSSENRSSQISPLHIPTWYLAPSFASTEAFQAFDKLVQATDQHCSPSSRYWKAEVELESGEDNFIQNYDLAKGSFGNHWSLQDMSDVVNVTGGLADIDSSGSVDLIFVAHLARTLHSTLISTFLDWAPTVFSPSVTPPDTEVKLIMAVGRTTRSLYGTLLQGSALAPARRDAACKDLATILGYMTTYFPFRPSGNRDMKLEQAFQDLSLIFCELTSLLVLASETESSYPLHARREKSRNASSFQNPGALTLSIQTERVSEFVIRLLRGEPMSSQVRVPLSSAAYIAILPTIWLLLNNRTINQSSEVFLATVEHAVKTSSKSALKKATVEFLARIVLLDTERHYQGTFTAAKSDAEGKALEEWIAHLPQTLWELGSNNLPATEVILRSLLRIAQRKSSVHSQTMTLVRSRLVPYFSVNHVTRGRLPGPYSKLPRPLRKLALDLVTTISTLSETRDDGLEDAVDQAVAVDQDKHIYRWSFIRLP